MGKRRDFSRRRKSLCKGCMRCGMDDAWNEQRLPHVFLVVMLDGNGMAVGRGVWLCDLFITNL